jgi:hypothetical protein
LTPPLMSCKCCDSILVVLSLILSMCCSCKTSHTQTKCDWWRTSKQIEQCLSGIVTNRNRFVLWVLKTNSKKTRICDIRLLQLILWWRKSWNPMSWTTTWRIASFNWCYIWKRLSMRKMKK